VRASGLFIHTLIHVQCHEAHAETSLGVIGGSWSRSIHDVGKVVASVVNRDTFRRIPADDAVGFLGIILF